MKLTPVIASLVMAPIVVLESPTSNAAEVSGMDVRSATCAALRETDLSATPDAPTWLVATESILAGDDSPAYCKVIGTIDSRIGIEMRLPMSSWNGKFLQQGCGGWCGEIFADECMDSVRRGYACIASDMGHKGSHLFDLRWWKDNIQAQLDFGFRATHMTAIAGKAIVAAFYGSAPTRSYFDGCSTGGYQGLMQAQRFPWDFDGIIAGAPDIDTTQANFRGLWWTRTNRDPAGNPLLTDEDLRLLHNAVLARCDLDDGVKDGIIGNPVGCEFEPSSLLCEDGQVQSCLSQQQVDAAEKFYSGPVNSTGERTSAGGFLAGSELTWGKAGWGSVYFRDGLAGFTTPAGFEDRDFDFNSDYKRLGLAPWYDNSNPDLRKLKAAGAKLLIYHGANDTDDPPGPVINYYETVVRTMGGWRETGNFFRLFLVPGMDHCGGGVGGMDVDWLTILEEWVEEGRAPDSIVGTHVSEGTEPTFTRPLFPYPDYAKYKGSGDVDTAENFRRVRGRRAAAGQ